MDLREELEKIYNNTEDSPPLPVYDNDFSAFADDPDEFLWDPDEDDEDDDDDDLDDDFDDDLDDDPDLPF
jgi:hypothetical protein